MFCSLNAFADSQGNIGKKPQNLKVGDIKFQVFHSKLQQYESSKIYDYLMVDMNQDIMLELTMMRKITDVQQELKVEKGKNKRVYYVLGYFKVNF